MIEPKCDDCKMLYIDFPMDVVLPDSQWEIISGHSDGGGLLCAACIIKRAAHIKKDGRSRYYAARLTLAEIDDVESDD
jgi:hypothetical protein